MLLSLGRHRDIVYAKIGKREFMLCRSRKSGTIEIDQRVEGEWAWTYMGWLPLDASPESFYEEVAGHE